MSELIGLYYKYTVLARKLIPFITYNTVFSNLGSVYSAAKNPTSSVEAKEINVQQQRKTRCFETNV